MGPDQTPKGRSFDFQLELCVSGFPVSGRVIADLPLVALRTFPIGGLYTEAVST